MSRTRFLGRPAPALLAALLVAPLGSCTTTIAGSPSAGTGGGGDRQLVAGYFAELNKAAEAGPSTQRDFLRRTQHPDYTDELCDLGDLTLEIEPALSTLRADPRWAPESGQPPRGEIYVVAVSIRIRQDGTLLGQQIGSQRVVLLGGEAYGFAPCPTG